MTLLSNGGSGPGPPGPRPSRLASRLAQPGWRATEQQMGTLRAAGHDVMEVYGMPIRPLPEHVIRVIHEAERESLVPPPSAGLPVLREAVAGKLLAEAGAVVDPGAEVIVTTGAMQAVNVICRTLLEPGDEVLVPSPSFFFYGCVELAGGKIVYAPMEEASGWAWNVGAIEAAITDRTKLLILCNPVNPTGYVVPDYAIRDLSKIAQERGIWVLVDESYDRMVYNGVRFSSAARHLEAFRDVLILAQSVTKSYAMSAWRIGYIVAGAEISTLFGKILEWELLYGNAVAQRAAAAAISGPQDWLADIGTEFQGYRDEIWPALSSVPGLSAVQPMATPYFLLNVAELGVWGDEFAQTLVAEFGVPATGGSHFHAPDHVRIGFGAPSPRTRQELCSRVARAAELSLSRSG